MRLEQSEYGYTQIVISDNCEFDDFYSYADLLKNKLQVNYLNRLDDFDTLYWTFLFDGTSFDLSYNVFLGINIYPSKGFRSSAEENELVKKLFEVVSQS